MPVIIKNSHFYNNGSSNRAVGTSGTAGMPGTPGTSGVSGFVSITEGLPVSYEEIQRTPKLESGFVDLYEDYDFSPYSAELKNQAGVIDEVNKVSSEVSGSNSVGNKGNVGKVKNEVVSIKIQASPKSTKPKENKIKKMTTQTFKTVLQHAFPNSLFVSIYEKIRR